MALGVASCAGGSGEAHEYISVKMDGSSSWSVIKVADGSVVLDDEFKNAPFGFDHGSFIVRNADGAYDIYSLSDVRSPLNKESFVDITPFSDGYALAAEKDQPISVVNYKGEVIATLAKNIKYASPFSEGLAFVETTDGKYGYIDTKGEMVISTKYDNAGYFSDGCAMVSVSDGGIDRVSIIDKNGETVFKFDTGKYQNYGTWSNGYLVVKLDDQAVVLNKKGEKVCKLGQYVNSRYDSDLWTDGKLAIYYDGDSYGLKNFDGETVVRAKYDGIFMIYGRIVCTKDDKWGMINADGEEVMPFDYKSLLPLSADRFLTEEGNKTILIDKDGKEVCKDSFDDFKVGGGSYAVRSQYFDAEGFASNIMSHIEAKSCYGYAKGTTLNAFRSELDTTPGWSEGHRSSLSVEKDGTSLLMAFPGNFATDYGPYWAYDWRYEWNMKLAAITWSESVSDYGTGAEAAFAKAFDRMLEAKGFKRLNSSSPYYVNSAAGTAVGYGYSDGTISLAYFMDSANLPSGSLFSRTDRRGNSDELDYDVVVEEAAAVDTCAPETEVVAVEAM